MNNICTCPTECDCQSPNPLAGQARLISNTCPIHNENPDPDPDCPIVGVHANGSIDKEGW